MVAALDEFEAIHDGHADVGDEEVGGEFLDEFERRGTVVSLADDREARVGLGDLLHDVPADHRFVLGDDRLILPWRFHGFLLS